jgi:hypothetical protein
MSTLQATNLKNAASASNNIVLDTSGNATFAGTAAMASSFLRNRIINGDMRIDQRNAGASVSINNSSAYTMDRWFVDEQTDGVCSVQRSTTAPAGFTNSLLFTTTTADASLGASQYVYIGQAIEGFNVADLGWGAAGAQTVTLSFWVRSSLTGTFGGSLRNGAANRAYPFTYTINSANTFEYKTVTVSGDTTGTWATDNAAGLWVFFGLGVGSAFSGTAGAWAGSNFLSATGGVSVIGTLNATWQVTGVQLEVGTVATPFERRQYGQELALCQRYFYRNDAVTYFNGNSGNGTVARGGAKFGVTMRATPAITVFPGSNLGGTVGNAYVSNTNSNTPINFVSTITTDGFDSIGNTGNLPSASFLYAVSFTAAAEL